MVHFSVNWRTKTRRVASAFSAVALPLTVLAGSAANAQSIMRTPSLHIDSRITTINPTVAPRINPVVGTRVNPTIASRPNVGITAIARTPSTGVSVGVTSIARMPAIKADGGTTSIMRMPDAHDGITHIGGEKLSYARYSHILYPVCEYAN